MTDETKALIEAEKNAPPMAVCPVAEKSVQGEPIKPKIDFTTGNVTVYSNASIALKVLIY